MTNITRVAVKMVIGGLENVRYSHANMRLNGICPYKGNIVSGCTLSQVCGNRKKACEDGVNQILRNMVAEGAYIHCCMVYRCPLLCGASSK